VLDEVLDFASALADQRDDVHVRRRPLRDRAHERGLSHARPRKDADPLELLRLVRRAAEGKTALSGDMAVRVAESLRRDPDEQHFDQAMSSLSPRQREVVALVADGKSNREIADELCISEGTVKNYVTKILEVMGVSDRTKLAILLVRHQMTR
jgi:RNA polymerase sigma factor (sigma-70 family)